MNAVYFLPAVPKSVFMNLLASGLVFVMNRKIDHTVLSTRLHTLRVYNCHCN